MNVLFVDTVHPILWERLSAENFNCIDGTAFSLDEVLSSIEEYHGLVIRSRFPIDHAFLSRATSLRFIARSGSGMENIDVQAAKERNVQLFNAPEGNQNAVAEHALGMLLSLFNKLNQGDAQVRGGIWDREGNRGIELAGKTVGIIGHGHNGSSFSKVLSALGCRILAYDKYKSGYAPTYVEEVELDILFQEADILSLHIPLTEETRDLITREFIEKMAKPFYFINTSRGPIAKTETLLWGLESGKIKGACLDVLDLEKSSFDMNQAKNQHFLKLTKMNNVIFSPHVAGWTVESYEKLSNVLADKVLESFEA